jgi:hypothetical protein
VLAEVHGRDAIARMHVVGRRDDDAVDIFLLVEHLTVVGMPLNFRQLFFDKTLEIGVRILRRPARIGFRLRLGQCRTWRCDCWFWDVGFCIR